MELNNAVSRFDLDDRQGSIVGEWTAAGESLASETFALDGNSASAALWTESASMTNCSGPASTDRRSGTDSAG